MSGFRALPLEWLRRLPSCLPLTQAIFALRGAITDGETHTLRSLQSLGWSPAPVHLDGEVARMEEGGVVDAPLFTVLRYDLDFDAMARQGVISAGEAASFQNFDAPGDMGRLWELSAAAGREVVAGDLRYGARMVGLMARDRRQTRILLHKGGKDQEKSGGSTLHN